MGAEETKHDLLLKRVNVTLAILAGLCAVIVGLYNLRKTVFSESGAGDISAVVRAEDGAPVSRAHVDLMNAQNALVSASQADKDGRYQKKGLEAGSYFLKISQNGFEPQVATVSIAQKKVTEVEIVLRPVGQAQAAGSPIRSAIEEVGASWIKNLGKAKTDASRK